MLPVDADVPKGLLPVSQSSASCLHCRAAETSQDVESLRPPRFIHEDGVIRPYKQREGLGSQMLQVRNQTARRCNILTLFRHS